MRIGLIADTHGALPLALAEVFSDCDLILHAGDIGSPSVLDNLGQIAPVEAVLGNNDRMADYPGLAYQQHLALAGNSVFMTHTAAEALRYIRACTGSNSASTLPGICIHGHSHQPLNQVKHGVLIINPGSVSRPRGGSQRSVAVLELVQKGVSQVWFVGLG